MRRRFAEGLFDHALFVEKTLAQEVTQLAADDKQRLLSRLLARVAHEIRNPLSSLDIHVQLLEEDLAQLAPEVREKAASRFEVIHGELNRLEMIVRQFLRLSAPSELELQTVNVDQIVAHVCELLRPEADARAIEIRIVRSDELPVFRGDAGQLTQALVNLVINAIQAVERRGWIEVVARRSDLIEGVTLEVRDSGPGVPPEQQTLIFEPYFTTKPDGNGLGLWIVQQIVSSHRGKIEVINAPEGGAVFALHLPAATQTSVRG
jgi:signal transduction histidine kinase